MTKTLSELTAVRQVVKKTNYKADVVQHQLGNLQKQFTGLQESMNRVEALLQRLVNLQAQTLDQTVGRCTPNLRPTEEPRTLPDLNQPAELEMEMTRRIEDLRQSNLDSTQGVQLMSTPEGNFNFPSIGFSVMATGWGQDPLPHPPLASPESERNHTQYLDDRAILNGTTVIRGEVGLSLDKADKSVLGTAAKVVLNKELMTIVGDGSTQEEVTKRVAQIKNLIEAADQEYEKEKLNERIAKLAGGVAVIQVGAQTEIELKEKKLRVEDVLNATKAAVEEGIVVGGGCTLVRLAAKVDAIKDSLENDEQKVGAEIVRRALSYPLKLIAKNAGDWVRLKEQDKKRSQVVRIWDPGTGSKNMKWRRHVLTKDTAGSVKFWEITRGAVIEDFGKVSFEDGELTSIISNAHVGNAYSLARTHLPDVLFTGGEDGAIRLFNVYDVSDDEDINPAATWVPHTGPVHSLAFEYPWLVSASSDGRIALIDLRKLLTPKSSSKHPFRVKSFDPSAIEPPQRMLHGFGCSLFSIDIGADRIVCGGDDGGVRVWNFSEALAIEKRAQALRSLRQENRMRRRKAQVEMNTNGRRADQCSIAVKRNLLKGNNSVTWHNKLAINDKVKS